MIGISPQPENAEILGLRALAWLAGAGFLERFMNASGIDTAGLRAAAGQPETAGAVLDFLLANEDLLLGFCETAEIAPQTVRRLRLERPG